MADTGEGPGLPLFLDQTEARRAEKNFLRLGAPLISGSGWAVPPLSEGLHPPFEAYPCILCHDVSQRDTSLPIASLSYITLASIRSVLDRVIFMDRLVIEDSRINLAWPCLRWTRKSMMLKKPYTLPSSLASFNKPISQHAGHFK